MKTAMQKISDQIKWEDIELKTTSIFLQEEEKQQILDAFAHGVLTQMILGNKKRNIEEMAEDYYDLFFNQNHKHDDKI